MFSAVVDYLKVEKGWFAPYLFASARRPDIPRSMKPDVIFCQGPFLHGELPFFWIDGCSCVTGDYRVGETLLAESTSRIEFCEAPMPDTPSEGNEEHGFSISRTLNRIHSHSSDDVKQVTSMAAPPPRRVVVVLVGLKPHRKLWATSKRPGESVIKYVLCDGCPAIVVPAKTGAPLVAWDGTTVEELWEYGLPGEGDGVKFGMVVAGIFEFLDMFVVDWGRVVGGGREAVEDAVKVLVAAAVKTKESGEVRKEVDEGRCGIAMWRIS